MDRDPLIIAGKAIHNRFFLGTGKFGSQEALVQTVVANQIDLLTVAMRRVALDEPAQGILEGIPPDVRVMANTSGARTAEEAVRIAMLAREAAGIDWIKIEVIADHRYLLPDPSGTIEATRILAQEGFTVLPYMFPDLYTARALAEAGAAALMPLGSLIGSLKGIETETFIRILIEEFPQLPVIVDAGIGLPHHAAQAMEMGAAAVLANTAVAIARDPVEMAGCFCQAVAAGRRYHRSNAPSVSISADASSPVDQLWFDR
jgi:thiazole synthase